MDRMKTHEVKIGNVVIGADNPIAIQSMTNTKTDDIAATVAQIKALEKAGCDIIRCAVPDESAAKAIDRAIVLSGSCFRTKSKSSIAWLSSPTCARNRPRLK